ncbi:hypothetical protein AZI86_05795 [Bdellovibrio bacteriovorus]|uniref:Uncharacterized protein n=1 Tax=Bdellovibrio bacteriovorus TaxID=959 RepID=A0A150WQB2_BDEBC|nr:hypothetical protein [Bdellovibrio bacteriovorus]KYG66556.1 hypothetical protein AZI86_05795 [Bdellovibrio bacteriovorus]
MMNLAPYLCAILLTACTPNSDGVSNTKAKESKAITTEELKTLQVSYEKNLIKATDKSDHDPVWTAEVILPQIHGWFTPGKGLKAARSVYEQYVIYELKPIPPKVLQELDQVLMPGRYSMAILTKKFWQEVAAAQKSGLRIGFLSSRSAANVSGVYFNYYRMIGLSVLSEPGTLPHEIRHHMQYKKIDVSYEPEFISKSCMADMSRAMGEIDATTFELPLYRGIEEEFSTLTERHQGFAELRTPQLTLLTINLNYPTSVSFQVSQNKECPSDINQAMTEMYERFSKKESEVTSQLRAVSSDVFRLFRLNNAVATEGCTKVSNDRCQRYIQQISEFQQKHADQKEQFLTLLEAEITERRAYVSSVLEKLDDESKKDLCGRAIGFANFVKCEDQK